MQATAAVQATALHAAAMVLYPGVLVSATGSRTPVLVSIRSITFTACTSGVKASTLVDHGRTQRAPRAAKAPTPTPRKEAAGRRGERGAKTVTGALRLSGAAPAGRSPARRSERPLPRDAEDKSPPPCEDELLLGWNLNYGFTTSLRNDETDPARALACLSDGLGAASGDAMWLLDIPQPALGHQGEYSPSPPPPPPLSTQRSFVCSRPGRVVSCGVRAQDTWHASNKRHSLVE
ncbi:Protein of unknown function [Gryllus bimaculatus]|nr:Protein of unknown function [Gryllus bimaculatus]